VRKDRNNYYEAIKGKLIKNIFLSIGIQTQVLCLSAHNAVVTCSVFAPNPDLILKQLNCQENSSSNTTLDEVTNFVTGDLMSKKVNLKVILIS
jgi:hypothetical protein